MFEKFFHEVTGPYIWGLILLLSLRAIFSSVRKRIIRTLLLLSL